MLVIQETEPHRAGRAHLREDWQRFSGCAFVILGVQQRWQAGLDQLQELFDAYAEAGRDNELLYRLFDLLVEHCYGRAEGRERIRQFAETMGFAHVSAKFSAKLARAALPYAERQQAENREWMRGYLADQGKKRAAAEAEHRKSRKP